MYVVVDILTYEPNMDKPQDVKRKCLGYVFEKCNYIHNQ